MNGKQSVILCVVLAAVGVLGGVAAHVLKACIAFVSRWACSLATHPAGGNWVFVVLPVAGVLAAALFQRYVVHRNLEQGTHQVRRFLNLDNPTMPSSLSWAPLAGNVITLGLGGSAGAEGPMAFAIAATASTLARWARMSADMMRQLIGVGAGAGIAAIFSAPLAGVLFVIEVVAMPMTTQLLVWLFAACIIAGQTARWLNGWAAPFDIDLPPAPDMHAMLWVVLLGLVAGLYSLYYAGTAALTSQGLDRAGRSWGRYVVSGLWIGAMLFLFPSIYGEGYGVMNSLFAADQSALLHYSPLQHIDGREISPVVATLLGVLLCKGSVTRATNVGGGVAGSFAPTLFAGCLLGYLFGLLCLPHGCALTPQVCAFMGMAGVMSGVIKAPLMAMFLSAEMSGSFDLLMPLAVVSVLSYAVASSGVSLLRKVTQRL